MHSQNHTYAKDMSKRRSPRNTLSVREFHALGQKLNDEGYSDPQRYSPDVIVDAAEKMHVSTSHLFKARKFARMYDKDDLAKLVRLSQPNGSPLGIGHIRELIAVEDAVLREKLQAQAAEKGWSVRDLAAERARALGKSPGAHQGGRRPKVPTNAVELKTQLAQRADNWIRWYAESADVLKKAWPKDRIVGSSKCSKRILRIASMVDEQMRALAAELNTHE